jgi:CheY-like chemotaxis protein
MKNRTLLLVEGNLVDEALTIRALHKNNIENQVVVVRDGKEALDFLFCRNNYADRDPYDMPRLILLEMKLPKIKGLDVLRCLREDDRTRMLPIVIFSSSDEEKDVQQSYRCGANSYIQKSTDFVEFTESIRQIGLYWLGVNVAPPNKFDFILPT